MEAQKSELEGKLDAATKKCKELETHLNESNQALSLSNSEKLSIKGDVEKLTKESAGLKAQLQASQTQLETLQSHRTIDNVDIQKKYQVREKGRGYWVVCVW